MVLELPLLDCGPGAASVSRPRPRASMTSTFEGSEFGAEPEGPNASDGSRWSKRSQTTLQKITELCAETINNTGLVSVRRLNVMQLKNHKAQMHLKRRSVIVNKSTARLAGQPRAHSATSEPAALLNGQAVTEDAARRTSDVVQLLTVWDKYSRAQRSEEDTTWMPMQDDLSSRGASTSGASGMLSTPQHASSRRSHLATRTGSAGSMSVSILEGEANVTRGCSSSLAGLLHSMAPATALSTSGTMGNSDMVVLVSPPRRGQTDDYHALQRSGGASRPVVGNPATLPFGNGENAEELQRSLDSMPSIREVTWKECVGQLSGTPHPLGAIADSQPTFAGSYGSPEKLQERLKATQQLVIQANPAGFEPNTAAAEFATSKDASNRARKILEAMGEVLPSDAAAAQLLRDSVQELHYRRPYFAAPHTPKQDNLRRAKALHDGRVGTSDDATASGAPAPGAVRAWQALDSLWRSRRIESDAQDLYDTPAVWERQLQYDWQRLAAHGPLRELLLQVDAGVQGGHQSLEALLEALRRTMSDHREMLVGAFIFYSLSGRGTGDAAFSIGPAEWQTFVNDTELAGRWVDAQACSATFSAAAVATVATSTSGASRGRTPASSNVFASGGSTGDGSHMGDMPCAAHGDTTITSTSGRLLRYQFFEALLRLAVARLAGRSSDRPAGVVAALTALLQDCLAGRLPAEARHDANRYRRTRLYTQLVVEQLEQHQRMLLAMYNLQKARTRSKHLGLDGWVLFLQSVNLLGPHTGVTAREARLLFGWSQMTVVDEIGRRGRAISITFVDFLEAICRLADTMSPPPFTDMRRALREGLHLQDDATAVTLLQSAWPYHTLYSQVQQDTVPLIRRPSAGLVTPKTRLLYMKVDALMSCVQGALHQAWGTAGDRDHLLHKLTALAKAMAC